MLDIIKDLVRASCHLRRQTGRQPTAEDLSRRLRVPLKDVRRHLEIAKGLVSMDDGISDDDGGQGAVTEGLAPHEELILSMRFEIDMGGDPELEEIGRRLLETRRRGRRIEAKAPRGRMRPKRPNTPE